MVVDKLVDKLKLIRLQKKITHEELSRLTGLSQKHISNVENHKAMPSIETLQKLAYGLGVQIELKLLEEQAS
ncbi:DNA-binding transcriptional regulator, XRE-family HTH domain [Desulfotomaculum arcticum]|uniref:DNA-binding transcriptional regulator, XRE-family HTH domain n=1 Tax=Desulfotruncus arcticus DSM 17038 TaxID=1121424 RepID=A0A1I2ZF23_9FIRM|nr:helix-turn-helix transcriptional regulator [Desulfotruncus arcticus]SFH36324.1 DNA-binding transcriptional regulator, XRE-family HTH domain [Desulfotomaculum arcticum] [Desulfotruncus arcticus DSM 17038]